MKQLAYPATEIDSRLSGVKQRIEVTGTSTLTDAQVLDTLVTNYGMTAGGDTTLPAYSGGAMFIALTEAAAQTWNIKPPSGEAFIQNGTTLSVDASITCSQTVGDFQIFKRVKTGTDTYAWHCYNITQSNLKELSGWLDDVTLADGGDITLPVTKGVIWGNGDSRIYGYQDDKIRFRIGTTDRFEVNSLQFSGLPSYSAAIKSTAPTATSPGHAFNLDGDTGTGRAGADQLSQIAGGVEAIRSLETNGVIYNILNATQQDSISDATTNGTTTITKTGENFSTTCEIGDTVLIYDGSTTADYGVYSIATVTDNENLVLDRAPSGSDTDVDFYVFRGGLITTGESLHVGPHIIKTVNEPGLSDRFTFGLGEKTRTMVICDSGDVDTDFGLVVSSQPALSIFNAAKNQRLSLKYNLIDATGPITLRSISTTVFYGNSDLSSGDLFSFLSGSGRELIDTDGHQAWVSVEPKVNQSGTAAYDALYINTTETATGDGSTGDGNNLINAAVSGTSKFRVDNTGRVVLAETTDPAALADHGFVYAKDVSGTGEVFAADAAGNVAQLTAHNDTLFTPDPAEAYPWMPYFKNSALGKEVAFDMSKALRDLEAITGNKYIYYRDIPKTDLETLHKQAWIAKYIKDNTVETEVTKDEALETVQVEERTLYDTEVTQMQKVPVEKTVLEEGEEKIETIMEDREVTKIVKKPKIIDTKITGYELVNGKVKEQKENIFETHLVDKLELREDCRFDESTGKFYKITKPTLAQAQDAADAEFTFAAPKYIKDRLVKNINKSK